MFLTTFNILLLDSMAPNQQAQFLTQIFDLPMAKSVYEMNIMTPHYSLHFNILSVCVCTRAVSVSMFV